MREVAHLRGIYKKGLHGGSPFDLIRSPQANLLLLEDGYFVGAGIRCLILDVEVGFEFCGCDNVGFFLTGENSGKW
ncbi:MAG: hypothetical protein POELPBGB_01665 [Bacteroidia bacterium]|nr:hypothetical protein [Bacteroidia bacterium]